MNQIYTSSVKKLVRSLTGCVLIILILSSCINDEYDFDKTSWKYSFDPKLAITIGHTNFRIDSILKNFEDNDYIHSTDSGLIYVVYDKELEFYRGEDKFSVPDVQVNINVTLNASVFKVAVFPGSGKVTIDTVVSYPLLFDPTQRIDSLDLKSMLMQLTVNSTIAQPGKMLVTFPGISKNKVNLKDSFNITAGNFNQTHPNDAAGHQLRFSNIAPGVSNFLIRLQYTLQGNPGSAIGPGQLTFNLTTSNIEYYVLYGYVGQQNLLNATDSIDLAIFSNDITNKIQWKDPKLTLYVDNSYVLLPIRLNINNVSVHSRLDNVIYNVNLTPNPVEIQSPANGNRFKKDSVVYNKPNNPDFFNAIESAPDYIKFHVDAFSNPRGDEGENIIVDTSTIKVKSHFYLPLWFRSGEFGTTDTMDFDLRKSMGNELDSIEAMLFRIVSENGMPIDMRLQIYFTDSNYIVLDSAFHSVNNKVLAGGKLDASDRVISPTRNVLDMNFSAKQLNAIMDTKKLLIKVYANTVDYSPVNGRYVKFFTDYKFKLSFACQFQAKFTGYLK